jgi:hypothetical protein
MPVVENGIVSDVFDEVGQDRLLEFPRLNNEEAVPRRVVLVNDFGDRTRELLDASGYGETSCEFC